MRYTLLAMRLLYLLFYFTSMQPPRTLHYKDSPGTVWILHWHIVSIIRPTYKPYSTGLCQLLSIHNTYLTSDCIRQYLHVNHLLIECWICWNRAENWHAKDITTTTTCSCWRWLKCCHCERFGAEKINICNINKSSSLETSCMPSAQSINVTDTNAGHDCVPKTSLHQNCVQIMYRIMFSNTNLK